MATLDRQNEKEEMKVLNKELEKHMAKTTHLMNKQMAEISSKLKIQKSSWEKDKKQIDDMISTRFTALADELQRTKEDKGRLEVELKMKEDNLVAAREEILLGKEKHTSDSTKLKKLTHDSSMLEVEIAELKLSIDESDKERVRQNDKIGRLKDKISSQKQVLISESHRLVTAEHLAKSSQEELELVKRVHMEEINHLVNSAFHNSTAEIQKQWTVELSEALTGIRNAYDASLKKYREDLKSEMRRKSASTFSEKEIELSHYRKRVERLEKVLKETTSREDALITENDRMKRQIESDKAHVTTIKSDHMLTVETQEMELSKLRRINEHISKQLLDMVKSNPSLAAEIEEYRRLLNFKGGDTLRRIASDDDLVDGNGNDNTQQLKRNEEQEEREGDNPDGNGQYGKIKLRKISNGPVVIDEVHHAGKYILLVNTAKPGVKKDVDLSNWILQHSADSEHVIEFTFPRHTVLRNGDKLKIWANGFRAERGDRDLVMEEYNSWGKSVKVMTVLKNNNKQEVATLNYEREMENPQDTYEEDDSLLQ